MTETTKDSIQPYYFATYAKALVDSKPLHPKQRRNKKAFDNVIFYDKTFYCAYLYPSTREKHVSCEEFVPLATFSKEDCLLDSYILSGEEWVKDLSESTLVCVDQTTFMEVDTYEYGKENGYECSHRESGMIKFSAWC